MPLLFHNLASGTPTTSNVDFANSLLTVLKEPDLLRLLHLKLQIIYIFFPFPLFKSLQRIQVSDDV